MSWAARLTVVAAVVAAVLAAAAALARGGSAAVASACGSCLATAAQGTAVALLRPAMGAPAPAFMQRWAAGMAVRGASALVLVGLVVVARAALPALWMAIGYLGVLLPLLFVETRFLR